MGGESSEGGGTWKGTILAFVVEDVVLGKYIRVDPIPNIRKAGREEVRQE